MNLVDIYNRISNISLREFLSCITRFSYHVNREITPMYMIGSVDSRRARINIEGTIEFSNDSLLKIRDIDWKSSKVLDRFISLFDKEQNITLSLYDNNKLVTFTITKFYILNLSYSLQTGSSETKNKMVCNFIGERIIYEPSNAL